MKLTNNFLLLPSTAASTESMLTSASRSEDDIRKTVATTGIRSVHQIIDPSLSKFIFEGIASIKNKHLDVLNGVDAVVVVSQTYDGRIPSISARIQAKFNLPSDTYCIDVMDGCSGWIKAISLAELLELKGKKKILIIAGDLNSMITKSADIGTKILFGDGLSVSIFESDQHKVDVSLYNNGDEAGIISCLGADNWMHMNGFEVFRFTRNVVPDLVNDYLRRVGANLSQFDLIGLHQASKLVVSSIASSLKIENRFSDNFNCVDVGNIGAGSIGAWLSQIPDLTSKGKLSMLAVGFGSGLSWGLASIVVELERNEVFHVKC